MMKKLIVFISLLIAFLMVSFFSEIETGNTLELPTSRYSTPVHSFDVLNYKLNLDIYNCFKPPYNNNFTALEQITLRVDSASLGIALNAVNNSIVIDSVKFTNGNSLYYNHNADRLSISLNRLYYPGEIVNLDIYYTHNNVDDSAFFTNNGLLYTDCEPEGARRWFPCWDKPSDKATTDITTKVPANVLLGSNGRLADSVKTGDTIYYRWISRDPMSTYLVALAGSSNYKLSISYWHKPSNPLDSVPVRLYYGGWEDVSAIKDSINIVTDCFSQAFCEYPLEKIGFAGKDSNGYGCMENQTLIIMYPGSWSAYSGAAHEFGHHWFGDIITCGTWADIWLNESFGTYCEAVYAEYTGGYNAYKNVIRRDSSIYFWGNNHKAIYNPYFINHTPPIGHIFDEMFYYPITYAKGSCVLCMLRNVLGDTTFFNVLKSYLNDTNYRFKCAVTDDFTAKLNEVTGQDYSWFIDEWIKQPNHPKYTNVYEVINLRDENWRVNFTTSQNLSFSPFHTMPIELKIKFSVGEDTLVKVFNNSNNQLFSFDFTKKPIEVIFDPYGKITLKEAQIINGFANQCSQVSRQIADSGFTYDTIYISQQGKLKDLNILLNANHSNDGDLLILLYSPDKKPIRLTLFDGEGGQNFTNTIFDDTASLSISQGTPPFTGRYRPRDSMNIFNNIQISGDWILKIYDKKTGGEGILLNWCLQIGYENTVGAKEQTTFVSKKYKLYQNYPNPFNPVTNIKYQIAKNSYVTLKIYDILGKEVATLVNEKLSAGEYQAVFNGSGFASGIYFYKLDASDFTDIKRMVLIK